MKIYSHIILITTLFVLLIAAPTIFAAKVYKWVDKEGNVHYDAQKPATDAQEIRIKVSEPTPPAEEPDAAEDKNKTKAESKEEKVKVSNEKEAQEIEKKNAEIRKRNCSNAKKRLASITAGGRLYEVDEKGERSYWDDATRASKQTQAEAQVAEWCN